MVPLEARKEEPWGRGFYALQGLAGALWWAAVFLLPSVRAATLGHLPLEVAYADVPLFVAASLLAATGRKSGVWTVLVWTALVTLAMAVYATVSREAAWGALLMAAALGVTTLAAAEILLGHVPTEWLMTGPFVFRPTADSGGHLARTLRQLVAFWTVFLVFLPLLIVEIERRWRLHVDFPPALRWTGLALFVAASALGVASAVTMARLGEGTPLPSAMAHRLVVAGPYRFVRNPMAVAGIGQGAAAGLTIGSWMVVLYALVGSALWNWAIRPHEEADLVARFGPEFEAYQAQVRCWWPSGRKVTGP